MLPILWNDSQELSQLCKSAKLYISEKNYGQCAGLIADAMQKYPHAPQPHNLMGILLEQEKNHVGAMRHFRAAWALDPAYLPARYNMNYFGNAVHWGTCAYEETDCVPEPDPPCLVQKDKNGIVQVIKRRVQT